ncbi:AraC family transcriptional regulator [Marvinbryantia formatexigens]|uniref:AraC family transcriptional regulator n=1 Tax=Marvinbryantia formatexigens TaxID=168384 RepID=UPI00030E16AF|nr:AraC family transcriptional regulator [Marvinbryantia formatexigens]UWO23267.1 AraC family transcriptional regulator [Marvinbryantia formatexigens DSM 14469]SDG61657.1 transcriptional regulator, AraC family [Marvinbryantia formatexigens]
MSTSRYVLDSLATNPVDRSVTRLLYVSTARYSAEWHSTLHTHPCAELFFITGGCGYLQLASQSIPITTSDVITVNSNVEHTEVSSDELPLEYIVLGIDGLEAVAGDSGEDGYSIVHFQANSELLLFYLNNLLKEIESKQPGYNTVCQDLLEVVLLLLMRRSQFTVTFVPSSRKSSREAAIVRRYIDNHFKENITLDDLAAVAHVSKYYLAHLFRHAYDTSPISYLLSCRIQESLYLLTETDLTLSEISQMLGFSSPSYFSQSFRRIQGISPMQYRMQNRQDKKLIEKKGSNKS